MQTYTFCSQEYRQLFFTALCENGQDGLARIVAVPTGKVIFQQTFHDDLPRPNTVELEPYADYALQVENLRLPFLYLSECPELLEQGVTFLECREGRLQPYNKANIGDFYNQRFRNQYHFSTFKNWMNDPNGLCRMGDRYHLFYQMNPNGLEWDLMHWGHAVSHDLLHWTHLPIALYPQEEFYKNLDLKTATGQQVHEYKLWLRHEIQAFSGLSDAILGGAYTGCAMTDPDKIRLYFTRSIGPLKKGKDTRETQSLAYLYDEVHVVGEQTVIRQRPEGKMDPTFRDPKVVRIEGQEYMLIATTVDGVCSVMMYRRVDDANWDYMGVVLRDELPCNTFECVNFIQSRENPRQGALLCALQSPRDPYGRTEMTYCYMGAFDEQWKFVPQSRTLYDFGTCGYAYQMCDLPERTLSFGWVNSPYGEFMADGSVSNGCMTIPRETFVKDGRLYTRPATELQALEGEICYRGEGESFTVNLPDNCYKLDVAFCANTDFRIVFSENGDSLIGLHYDGVRLRLLNGKKEGLPAANLFCDIEALTSLTVYVDRSVVEIFVNDGSCVGTKDYFIPTETFACKALFRNPQAVTRAQVRKIRSIWR